MLSLSLCPRKLLLPEAEYYPSSPSCQSQFQSQAPGLKLSLSNWNWVMEDSLFCEEELLISPPSSPVVFSDTGEEREREILLRSCLERQGKFLPVEGYAEKLRKRPELSSLRLRAARWILMARLQLDLTLGTAFSALNFLDRFVSMYTHLKWEGWMMELLSVACLSIAAKFEEVIVFSLHSFPMEDLEHAFHPNSIQQMELTVLTFLDWRLNCITAHSFLSPLTHQGFTSLRPHLRRAATDRAAELLTGAALDLEFLQFSPFAVAISAARCTANELSLPDSAAAISDLTRLVPQEHIEEMENCCKCMEEMVVDQINGLDFSTVSPVTVILPESAATAVFSDLSIFSNKCKTRKRKKTDGLIDR